MATRVWNSSVDGNWSDPGPWGGTPPDPGDNIYIVAPNRTLTHSAGADLINNMTVNATLAVTGGSLTTTGVLDFQKATLANSAMLALQSGSIKLGTNGYYGHFVQGSAGNSAYLVNTIGGTIDFQTDISITGAYYAGRFSNSWISSFTNDGYFVKSGGRGVSLFNTSTINSGSIEVQSGTLDFAGGLTQTGALHIGAGAEAIIRPAWGYGTSSVSGSISLGDNAVLSGQSLALSANVTVAPTAYVQLTASNSITGGAWTGGGSLFNLAGATLLASGVVNLDVAFSNAGAVDVSGSLTLDDVVGSGFMTVGTTGRLELDGDVAFGQRFSFTGNSAQIVIEDAANFDGAITGAFRPFDTIRLVGIQADQVATNAAHELIVTRQGVVVATLQFDSSNSGQRYSVVSDNAGGSLISVGAAYAPIHDPTIIWNDGLGQALFWAMDGTALQASALVGGVNGPEWEIRGRADFDGDGRLDALWQNTATGQAVVWRMDGQAVLDGRNVGGANGAEWNVKATGDLNHDGKADIIWQNGATGQAVAWLMDGFSIAAASLVGPALGADWEVRATGDLDVDGRADIVLQNGAGQAIGWLMDGFAIRQGGYLGGANGTAWHVQGMGDIDGDGDADIVWQDERGQAVGFYMDNLTVVTGRTVGEPAGSGWMIRDVNDLNRDGLADLVWQTASGDAEIWTMGSNPGGFAVAATHTGPGGSYLIQPTPSFEPYQPIADFDFGGDRRADILWQNGQGQALLWQMNGTTVAARGAVGPANGANWSVRTAGDVNGDGRADMILQDANTGQVVIWEMDGAAIQSAAAVAGPNGANWRVMAAGDFDGDGDSDLVFNDAGNGQAVMWLMQDGAISYAGTVGGVNGVEWSIAGAGDLNEDGHDDLVWQDDRGQAVVWLMDGATVTASATVGGANGATWNVVGVGDLTGDGRDDLVWQNDQGQAVMWQMNGTSVTAGTAIGNAQGPAMSIENVADHDGDTRADILWERADGDAVLWLMDGVTVLSSTTFDPPAGGSWHLI